MGKNVEEHKQHMVQSVGKGSKANLTSPFMSPEDAERKLETLLPLLQKGASWLAMYEITAKACAHATDPETALLPHGFQALHMSDPRGKSVRLLWKAYGSVVREHAEHLEKYNAD